MSARPFQSALAQPIEAFVALRQLSGCDYDSQAQLLRHFDRYLTTVPSVTRPTRALIEGYERTLSTIAPRTRANRMSVVRQLCAFLSRSDPKVFVPEPVRTRSSRAEFRPYIYSRDEIRTLMLAAARLSGALRGATYRTLIGLLYSTGLRIGEAMALNLADGVDDGCLRVAQGKFRKARRVPLSPSTHRALRRYLSQRRRIQPNAPDAPVFLNERARRLHHCVVAATFRRLLRAGQIGSERHRPRVHDLRHTFACHRLLAWYQDGADVQARLPLLATYLGHVNIASTQVYLHPTQALLDQVSARFHDHYQCHLGGDR